MNVRNAIRERLILLSQDGCSAEGEITLPPDFPGFQGHFPGHPVMPGVLILEALAQTGAVAALSLPENRGKLALFGGVKNARFRRKVIPGDVLEMECTLTGFRGGIGFGKAKAMVGGEVAATAELIFALEKE